MIHSTVSEQRASFQRDVRDLVGPSPITLGWDFLWEFLADGRTPIRAISDIAVEWLLPYLYGPGKIVELGAPSDYYRRFAPKTQAYELTDMNDLAPVKVDMTEMPYADGTVDAFVSAFSLEHVYRYDKALAEIHRTLKPGGRLLLLMPFLYYYHAAPDDYVRLTKSALLRALSGFDIAACEPLGSRALFVAEMYHEKIEMGYRSSWLRRLLLRLLGGCYLLAYLIRPVNEEAFASAYVVLGEKR